jgi:hypothetical protein
MRVVLVLIPYCLQFLRLVAEAGMLMDQAQLRLVEGLALVEI